MRVLRNGRPVAEAGPAAETVRDPLVPNPQLAGVIFHEHPATPLSEDDWPEAENCCSTHADCSHSEKPASVEPHG